MSKGKESQPTRRKTLHELHNNTPHTSPKKPHKKLPTYDSGIQDDENQIHWGPDLTAAELDILNQLEQQNMPQSVSNFGIQDDENIQWEADFTDTELHLLAQLEQQTAPTILEMQDSDNSGIGFQTNNPSSSDPEEEHPWHPTPGMYPQAAPTASHTQLTNAEIKALFRNAAYEGDLDSLIELAETYPIDLNSILDQFGNGNTLLHIAVNQNAPTGVIEFLIQHGVNINAPNTYGNSPLNIAAIHGYGEIGAVLYAHNATYNNPAPHNNIVFNDAATEYWHQSHNAVQQYHVDPDGYNPHMECLGWIQSNDYHG